MRKPAMPPAPVAAIEMTPPPRSTPQPQPVAPMLQATAPLESGTFPPSPSATTTLTNATPSADIFAVGPKRGLSNRMVAVLGTSALALALVLTIVTIQLRRGKATSAAAAPTATAPVPAATAEPVSSETSAPPVVTPAPPASAPAHEPGPPRSKAPATIDKELGI